VNAPVDALDETLKESIRHLAARLGFPLCGFTTPDPPEEFSRYRNWVEKGLRGGMGYLASERALAVRADPRLLLPSARSIVVLGALHARPRIPETGGRIAAYALGRDYHDVFPERLAAVCRGLNEAAGSSHDHKVFTDTAPILERELGARAGLGWIGRNSMLIHPDAGSGFLLAEIFTSVPIIPDAPFSADRCGTCDRCVRACPTGCILPDRTIDARRCISYLTIEHRGPIPEELREKIGSWVFGCDLCQMVCPWNSRQRTEPDPEFHPISHLPPADLASEIRLADRELEARLAGTPIRRAGKIGYRRNLIQALGNSGRRDTAGLLSRELGDPEPTIRDAAEWAVRRAEALRKQG
jgi:epoxyqueuosine reductase